MKRLLNSFQSLSARIFSLVLVFGIYSCGFFESKNEMESNAEEKPQEDVFLFKGKTKDASQLPYAIYIGKDSIGGHEFPFEIDTMGTKQWASIRNKGGMLSIIEDSIDLYSDKDLDRLEGILGYQEIEFNPQILKENNSFSAELFGDILKFKIEQKEELDSINELWSGVLDKENSGFVIYKTDSIYRASFYFNENKYELKKINETYIIDRINQQFFNDEDEPLDEIEIDDDGDDLEDKVELFQDPKDFIDVLVCYSKKTRISSGGTSQINSTIGLAIAETNLSYKNSGVLHKLRLAGTYELDYEESGSSKTDVKWIKNNKAANDKRDEVRADIVVFIVEWLDGSCGRVTGIPSKISPKFAPYAYCVVRRDCATGYYSFGHEVGHLMGARHNCENDSTLTPFDIGHGFEHCGSSEPWRTVMSYSNCKSTRLPYWSNPSINYKEIAMGSINPDEKCKSNNSEVLNRASTITANFRVRSTEKLITSN